MIGFLFNKINYINCTTTSWALLFFSIPFSRALFNISAAMVFALLIFGLILKKLNPIKGNVASISVLILIGLIISTTLINSGLNSAGLVLKDYFPLALIPAYIMQANNRIHDVSWRSYILGSLVLILNIIISRWIVLPWG